MHGTSARENWEALPTPDTKVWAGRSGKVMSHKPDENAGKESHDRVVPAKCPNKGGSSSPAEGMEGSRSTKENTAAGDRVSDTKLGERVGRIAPCAESSREG